MLRIPSPSIAFEPCIPTQADRPPSGPGWIHEIKHDGYRLVARRDGAGVRLITRNGHDFSERYPAVASAVNRLRCRSCVVDGEVVIVDEDGRAVFNRLQQGPRTKPDAVLFAFDLLELDGQDLKREPLLTRKTTLLSLLKGAPHGILYNEHMEGDGAMIFRHACRLGCEGIVSKRGRRSRRSGFGRKIGTDSVPLAQHHISTVGCDRRPCAPRILLGPSGRNAGRSWFAELRRDRLG
jgi:bifunctional non-homologous end joining protein LigD